MVWEESGLLKSRQSNLFQELYARGNLELLKRRRSCWFLVRDGEKVLVLYAVFSGGGGEEALILIYVSNVFAPETRFDGLCGQVSAGSLIAGSLLADVRKVAHFVAVAKCLSLGLVYLMWVLRATSSSGYSE